jgi:hypothetical protein
MCGELPELKPCPSWCTGLHDCITPDGECIHTSSPAILIVAGSPLQVYIEAYVESCRDDPPPGQITWVYDGGNPAMTAQEANSFTAILDKLIDQLKQADCAR